LKVALIIPPRPYLFEQKALPNLGVMTVSAVFKQLGHEVEVLDFADGFQFVEADIHGLNVTTPDFKVSTQIVAWLRKQGAQKIVAGGPHAALMPHECLDSGFDAVSVGDGEVTVPGILKGERIACGWLENIDEAPHPDRTCLDLKKYNFKINEQPATSMMTSYSCVWGRCAFCCRPPFNKARFHSHEWVQEDLRQISGLGFSAVQVYDDEFFAYPKRDMKIIETLGQMGFTWRAFGYTPFLLRNKELLFQASKNGLHEVLLGIETGSNQIKKTINKGTTIAADKEAIKLLYFLGVGVKAAMVVMLPGESEETLKETWSFCEEMEPFVSEWDFTMLVPYPGSQIYEHPEQFDIKFDKTTVYQAYKGFGTEACNPTPVSTSKLSFEEGLILREALEQRFKHKNKEITK
jgi:radical SAM superfamily enzyme YgiQ (UPF0313 family)